MIPITPRVNGTLVIIIGFDPGTRLDLDFSTLTAQGRVSGSGGGCTGGSSGCAAVARMLVGVGGGLISATPQQQTFAVQTRPAKPDETYVLQFEATTASSPCSGFDNATAFLNSLDLVKLRDKYVLVMDENLALSAP